MDSSRLDDEHKLIARYAQRLAQEARTVVSRLKFSHSVSILPTLMASIKRLASLFPNAVNFICINVFAASRRFQNVPGRANGKFTSLIMLAIFFFNLILRLI